MANSDQVKYDAIVSIIRASDLPQEDRDNLVRFTDDPAKWEEFRAEVIHHVSILSDLPNSRLHRRAVGRLILALEEIS